MKKNMLSCIIILIFVIEKLMNEVFYRHQIRQNVLFIK